MRFSALTLRIVFRRWPLKIGGVLVWHCRWWWGQDNELMMVCREDQKYFHTDWSRFWNLSSFLVVIFDDWIVGQMTSWTSHFIKQASCWILIFIIQYQDLIGRPALIYLHASKSIFFVFIPHMWKVSLCLLTSSYYSPLHFASSWSVHCPRSAYMLKYHIQAMVPTNVVSSSVGWLVIVGWHNSAFLAQIRRSVNSVLQFHLLAHSAGICSWLFGLY